MERVHDANGVEVPCSPCLVKAIEKVLGLFLAETVSASFLEGRALNALKDTCV